MLDFLFDDGFHLSDGCSTMKSTVNDKLHLQDLNALDRVYITYYLYSNLKSMIVVAKILKLIKF